MAYAFGAPAPSPSPAGGLGFGGAPNPAPAPGGFFTGSTQAPAPGGFGSPTPAPSGGFGFGSPAPSSGGGFGGFGAPTPAPSSSGFPSFGSPSPAPSSSAFPSFGAPSPAPSSSAFPSFGAPSPAASGGFGGFGPPASAPSGGFGGFASSAPTAGFGQQQQQQGAMAAPISGNTPYSALPQDIRQAIDTIHESMMKHKRTMNNLQSMAPKLLLRPKQGEIISLSSNQQQSQSVPLSTTIEQLQHEIRKLEQETVLQTQADACKKEYETLIKQAVMHGQWQVEALAVRRGIHLKHPSSQNQQQQQQSSQQQQGQFGGNSNAQSEAKAQLRAMLDNQMAHVDRLERMPSPYLWRTLEDMEKRLQDLKHHVFTVQQQINNSTRSEEPEDIGTIVQSQHRGLRMVLVRMEHLHSQVEALRAQYRFWEKGDNVIERADFEEQERSRKVDDRIMMQYVQAASNTTTQPQASGQAPATGVFGAPTPAPGGFGGFGTPTPAPGGGIGGFGSSTPAPAPGGLAGFGSSTPAPAPGGNVFGSAPAPGGSLFGSTASSAGGNFFGSTPTPAPGASTTFNFPSSTSAPATTPKKGSKSRNKSRLGR